MTSDLVKNPVWVWGLPLKPFSLGATIASIDQLVEKRRPIFFITANTHYAMLTREQPDLREINDRAEFLVADGAPLVWASRRQSVSLPERVAGSDLIYMLCELAARKGYRLFFAGSAPGIAEMAANQLAARYPGLHVAGTAAPRFRDLSPADYGKLKAQIVEARTDILILAATMPMGERWLSTHVDDLGVPVSVNLGAALDFAAGRIRRAPRFLQNAGLEWAFRLLLEPRRLFSRYARNIWFLLKMTVGEMMQPQGEAPAPHPASSASVSTGKRGPR
jgi:N-acetylglucosaminyldiphosphoundecaprenol N-acetyl-beta-D-mannosaminyltransferase